MNSGGGQFGTNNNSNSYRRAGMVPSYLQHQQKVPTSRQPLIQTGQPPAIPRESLSNLKQLNEIADQLWDSSEQNKGSKKRDSYSASKDSGQTVLNFNSNTLSGYKKELPKSLLACSSLQQQQSPSSSLRPPNQNFGLTHQQQQSNKNFNSKPHLLTSPPKAQPLMNEIFMQIDDDSDSSICIQEEDIQKILDEDEEEKRQQQNTQSKMKETSNIQNYLMMQANQPRKSDSDNVQFIGEHKSTSVQPVSLFGQSMMNQTFAQPQTNHQHSYNSNGKQGLYNQTDYNLKYNAKTQMSSTSFNQTQSSKIAPQALFSQRKENTSKWNNFIGQINSTDEQLLSRYRSQQQQQQQPSVDNTGKKQYYEELFGGLSFKSSEPPQKVPQQQLANKNDFQKNIQQIESFYDQNKSKEKQKEAKDKIKERFDQSAKEHEKSIAAKERAYKNLGMNNLNLKQPSNQFQVSLPSISEIQKKREEKAFEDIKRAVKNKLAHKTQEKEIKQLEQIRKKEQEKKQELEQKKKKQQKERADIFSELFDYGDQKKEKESKEQSNTKLGISQNLQDLLQACEEKKQQNQQQEEEEEEGEIINTESKEEKMMKYHGNVREQELKKIRYHNRKSAEELIRPILNLELVEMFYSDEKPNFSEIPLKFESFHQYRDLWIPLFLYETFSQLINQRSESDKDRELLEAQGIQYNSSRQSYFEGYIQKANQDMDYIYLKLYESENSVQEKNGTYSLRTLDSLKEFDILLISEEPLPTKEIKKITNAEYLLKLKDQKGKMISIVTARRKRDATSITVKVDSKLHEEYLCLNVRSQDLHKVHVYYFDSLITTVREFRTIKSCEFFPTASIILDPTIVNIKSTQEGQLDFQKKKMNDFVMQFKHNFNESQCSALEHVSKMKQEDFLLIQGPPGTGKTHTIQGIISMLVASNANKVLICAPSNAAIDEIVLRISNYKLFGVLSDEKLKEKLLRLGSMDYDPLPNVKMYTLDEKVKEEMGDEEKLEQSKTTSTSEKLTLIKQRLQYISTSTKIITQDQCQKERVRLAECLKLLYRNDEKVQRIFQLDKEKKLSHLQILKDNYLKEQESLIAQGPQNEKKPNQKNKRIEVERRIIQRAQIICTTLSMAASEKLELIKSGEIEYLIVDEACQCVELTNLIPFEHEPKKVILVGDQQQLPATTFSENSDRTFYSRSLFERFLLCGVNRFMLSIQYRMHPLIREFPSNQFYDGKLEDAKDIQVRSQNLTSFVLQEIQQKLQNITFFDLRYGQEQTATTSKSNKDEATFIEALFSDLIKIFLQSPNFPLKNGSYQEKLNFICKELRHKIGIITPYKSQVRILKDFIYAKLRKLNFPIDLVEINTVDAYQGREKDIIIISCVRGSKERALGFLNDYRRMNVAITRAKHFLWVVGNSRTLKRNHNWKQFIEFAKKRKDQRCFIKFHSRESWEEHKLMKILLNENKTLSISDKQQETKDEDKNSLKDVRSQNTGNNESASKNEKGNNDEADKKRRRKERFKQDQEKFKRQMDEASKIAGPSRKEEQKLPDENLKLSKRKRSNDQGRQVVYKRQANDDEMNDNKSNIHQN